MPRTDLQQIFLESASEVLETMFFTGVAEEDSQEDSVPFLSAELSFHGSPSGRFGIRMPVVTARVIAANFLGLDESEISERQLTDVVCELSNMFCGSVLSRIEAGARFELSHPEIDGENRDWQQVAHAEGYTFGMEEGTITMWIATDGERPARVA